MNKPGTEKAKIRQIWNKYALIVIGNIVFFCLLYFFSLRPQNAENRAGEFLSIAQTAETRGRNEAAVELYQKILDDYAKTRAAQIAQTQLTSLKQNLKRNPQPLPSCPAACKEIDLEAMLRKGPIVYLATFLADHYSRVPADQAKVRDVIFDYLRTAVATQGIALASLKKETEFQRDDVKREFFDIRPSCVLEPDWIYDNFNIRNDNFYAWHNVNVNMTVRQGESRVTKTLRIEEWGQGKAIELLEFRVRKGEGVVQCKIDITSREGKVSKTEAL